MLDNLIDKIFYWLNKDMCSWTMLDCIYGMIVMSIVSFIIISIIDIIDKTLRKRGK